MDTFLSFLASKEIISACLFVLTIFSGYFAYKFKTYGDIDAKLEKLDKLDMIEKRLTGAKIEGQLAKIDKLEDIAKAQANGKTSVEFDYQKRKDDSDRLVEFGEDILNSFEMNREINSQLNTKLGLNGRTENKAFVLQSDYFTVSVINDLEKSLKSDDYYKLMSLVKVKYMVYFSKYDDDFNEVFDNWQNAMNTLNMRRTKLITRMMRRHLHGGDCPSTHVEITNLVSKYMTDTIITDEDLPKMNSQLIDAFENLNKKIRT